MSAALDLDDGLGWMSLDIHRRLGIGSPSSSPADSGNLLELIHSGARLGGSIDLMMEIPLVEGRGSVRSERTASWWTTLEGSITILGPATGTWSVTLVDMVRHSVIFTGKGLRAGEPISFSYKTDFRFQLQATATWSEEVAGTLSLRVSARY